MGQNGSQSKKIVVETPTESSKPSTTMDITMEQKLQSFETKLFSTLEEYKQENIEIRNSFNDHLTNIKDLLNSMNSNIERMERNFDSRLIDISRKIDLQMYQMKEYIQNVLKNTLSREQLDVSLNKFEENLKNVTETVEINFENIKKELKESIKKEILKMNSTEMGHILENLGNKETIEKKLSLPKKESKEEDLNMEKLRMEMRDTVRNNEVSFDSMVRMYDEQNTPKNRKSISKEQSKQEIKCPSHLSKEDIIAALQNTTKSNFETDNANKPEWEYNSELQTPKSQTMSSTFTPVKPTLPKSETISRRRFLSKHHSTGHLMENVTHTNNDETISEHLDNERVTYHYPSYYDSFNNNYYNIDNVPKYKLYTSLLDHQKEVIDIALSHDEKILISVSLDQTVRVWDIGQLSCINQWNCPITQRTKIFISHNNSFVIVLGCGNSIKVFKIMSGIPIISIKDPSKYINHIITTKDDRYIIGGCLDQTIKIYNFSNGKLLRQFLTYEKVHSLCMDSTNQYIIAGCDKSIQIWEWNGTLLKRLPHGDVVKCVAISDDDFIASASFDKTIKIWELHSGKLLQTLEGHSILINSILWLNDEYLISCSLDKSIKIWDWKMGQCVQTLNGHFGNIRNLCFSKKFNWIFSCSSDKSIKIWNSSFIPKK